MEKLKAKLRELNIKSYDVGNDALCLKTRYDITILYKKDTDSYDMNCMSLLKAHLSYQYLDDLVDDIRTLMKYKRLSKIIDTLVLFNDIEELTT